MPTGIKSSGRFKKEIFAVLLISLFVIFFSSTLCFAQGLGDWVVIKGRHFVVQVEGESARGFGQEVLREAERAYARISASLGCAGQESWGGKKRCGIFLYKDKASYLADTQAPVWSNASSGYYPEKVIRGYCASPTLLESELPHEIAHLVFRGLVGVENANVPLWLDEGIAFHFEEGRRGAILEEFLRKNAVEGKTIPLADLFRVPQGMAPGWSSPDQSASLFYAASYSLVNFLIERDGQGRFAKFLREFRQGSDFPKALERNYGRSFRSLNDLEKEWSGSLKFARSI